MRIMTLCISVAAGLSLACGPLNAQQFWYIPQIDEAKTPIELKLESPELALPGIGIGATRAQIMKRFEYALNQKWLSQAQVDQFCNDLKKISDKEESQRDAEGKLSFETKSSVAKQLAALNQKFEEQVLAREQNSPGLEGLQAREAMMIQRVNLAVSQGKMTAKKAREMKSEIRSVMAEMPENDLSDDLSKKIAADLSRISNGLEKEMRNPSMASRVLPFSR